MIRIFLGIKIVKGYIVVILVEKLLLMRIAQRVDVYYQIGQL